MSKNKKPTDKDIEISIEDAFLKTFGDKSTDRSVRDSVSSQISLEPKRIYASALQINDPWYRCQVLSEIAEKWPGISLEKRLEILAMAFQSALDTTSPNRIARVAIWPIVTLFNLGQVKATCEKIETVLSVLEKETNTLFRFDGIDFMYRQLKDLPIDSALKNRLFHSLIVTATTCKSWRKDRAMRDLIIEVEKTNPVLALELCNFIYKKQMRLRLFFKIREKHGSVFGNQLP